MSAEIPPWRGCVAKFPQPLSSKDEHKAERLFDLIEKINSRESNVHQILYRSGEGEKDILRQVFRWDLAPYEHVFKNGFRVNRDPYALDRDFYSLSSYVHDERRRSLDSRKSKSSVFISTTVSNTWYPPIQSNITLKVYRYEIYAPGGIWTSLTLGDMYRRQYKRLDEVAFVEGIAPQYIRSAQVFNLTGNFNGSTTVERVDNMLQINGSFNPQSHPLRLLNIEHPVTYYTQDKVPLVQRRRNKSRTNNPNILAWYSKDVANLDLYLTACLRSSKLNESYYILQNWVTLLNYDPGGNHDFIVKGPSLISQTFRSLEYTPFGEHEIDCALHYYGDEGFIFCGNLCALVNYAPNANGNDFIVKGPMTISKMFPFLKRTVFDNGFDAACEVKKTSEIIEYEAYVFKGNMCAHINYSPSNPRIIAQGQIEQMIPVLKGSIFGGLGITASYASHAKDEVGYFFKYLYYAQINVDANGEHHLSDVDRMGAGAPLIRKFVPQKNSGIDMREDAGDLPNSKDYYYDEYYDYDESYNNNNLINPTNVGSGEGCYNYDECNNPPINPTNVGFGEGCYNYYECNNSGESSSPSGSGESSSPSSSGESSSDSDECY